jgi:pimeloyl-ACP methyl ester carboxylesterase
MSVSSSAALILAAAASLLTGCADPGRRADALAQHLGFDRQIVLGAGFRHVLYRSSSAHAGSELHVYIEGDGTPFLRREEVAPDPTPRNLLMLRLMALDSHPSVYVGRPCYFGLSHDPGCSPLMWTLRRYSPEVVDSLAAAVRSESARTGARTMEIYGHSGGGTLAILVAERITKVSRVVTIGANLDITAWARLHAYSPLEGSINPLQDAPARSDLRILHLVGARDSNSPPSLVESAALARGGETVRVVPGFDHACCWESLWPSVVLEPR